MTTKKVHLAQLLDALERHCQRATYGAVGGVVDLPARSVMQGKEKNPRNSWVVSAENGMPSGYEAQQRHPLLESQGRIIKDADELLLWWKDHR